MQKKNIALSSDTDDSTKDVTRGILKFAARVVALIALVGAMLYITNRPDTPQTSFVYKETNVI